MEDLSSVAREVLEAQPFSALLGAKLTSFSKGAAVLEVPVRVQLLLQDWPVHGGVLSYAADNALTLRRRVGPGACGAYFGVQDSTA